MISKMVNHSSRDSPYGPYEQCGVGNSSDLVETLRSFKEKIRRRKVDNDSITQTQEKQEEVNAVILQFFSKF